MSLFSLLYIQILSLFQSKIDDVLNMIQNADTTGEIQPDTVEMLTLEGNIRNWHIELLLMTKQDQNKTNDQDM